MKIKVKLGGGLGISLFLMLCIYSFPISVHASAITSAQSGNWADTSTWTGGVVPGNGDTVTITNGHTVTIPISTTVTIGSSPSSDSGTPAISSSNSGILVVNGTLIYRGPIRQGNAAWTVGPGATLKHDSSVASGNPNYTWEIGNGSSNAKLIINGTLNSRVTITKQAGSSNSGGFGNMAGVGWNPGGHIEAQYADISNCGTADIFCIKSRLGGAGDNLTFDNVVVDSSGPIFVNVNGAAGFRFTNGKIINPLGIGTVNDELGGYVYSRLGLVLYGTNSISGAGFREISNSYIETFHSYWGGETSDLTVHNVVFAGNATNPPIVMSSGAASNKVASWDLVLLYNPFVAAPGSMGLPAGTLERNIFLRSGVVSNPHMVTINNGIHDSTIDGCIMEYDGTSNDGDGIQLEGAASSAITLTVKHCIVLPNRTDGSASFTLITDSADDTNWTIDAHHNTYVSSVGSGVISGIGSENATQHTGMWSAIRDNIVWRLTDGGGWVVKAHDSWIPVDGAYTHVDYNNKYNLNTDGYYSADSKFTLPSPPGTHDLAVNPDFVDSSRNFLSWAESVDGTVTTWADAIDRFKTGASGFTVQAAYDWINAGYAPTNSALHNAGHDGSDIGAVSYTPPLDTAAPILSLGSPSGAQSAGTVSILLSVITDETATCKYDSSSGVSYVSMSNTFSTTDSTSHSATISGLTDNSSYTYYVRCIDGSNNSNLSDYSISFSILAAAPVSDGGNESRGGRSGGSRGGNTVSVASPLSTIVNPFALNTIITSSHFNRILQLGLVGADVKFLQQFLNTHGITIAKSGPGSPGNETTYFGSLTRAALIKFQEANKEYILTSQGFSKGTGMLGLRSISLIQLILDQGL